MTNRFQTIREAHAHHFANHTATIVTQTDDITVIDWRDKDGSSEYYVNFFIDHRRGLIAISGDLGHCIASWGNPIMDVTLFADYMANVDHFMEKIDCTTDRYELDEEKLREDVNFVFQYILDEADDEDERDAIETYRDGIVDLLSVENEYDAPYSDELEELCRKTIGDTEWCHTAGKRPHTRIYLWTIALNDAIEQLKEKGEEQ